MKKTIKKVSVGTLMLVAFGCDAYANNTIAEPSVKGLKVLITNDDSIVADRQNGSNGKGLYELRRALCSAGADVITVGPWGKQSGMGGRIMTGGDLTVQEYSPPQTYRSDCADAPSGGKVFGVCEDKACKSDSPSGSPSDAVALAVNRFIPENYWKGGPDVVLSGINFGPNPGLATVHSGTVSAAVTAHEFGKAAIAFSEDVDLGCLDDVNLCPTYQDHAAFAVQLISQLNARNMFENQDLLLNVNYPVISVGETLEKPKVTVLGTGLILANVFQGNVGAKGGTYRVDLVANTPETRANADTTALLSNHISITAMSGDWTANHNASRLQHIERELRKVVKQL